ncbi:MAG: hypothetical protein GVY36_10400 [Verrucomicrobia bacterium]|jgi:REP element-mobilizing transposase RayT|nr:hypothetical protein [Verrucomicrobiota bacterium]
MEDWTHNGSDQLRRGRVSIPFARYFITLCVRDRIPKLTMGNLPFFIREVLREMHRAGDIEVICATTMPDHFHILYRLGNQLSLSQIQAKIKSKTKDILAAQGIEWQANFYDHYLRQKLPMDRFARYIYLNPYRKKLISTTESWPYWFVNREQRPEFTVHLVEGKLPPAEWLQNPDAAKALIDADSVS